MLEALYIFVDDEFTDPVYADPNPQDLDPDLWERLCEVVLEAIDADGPTEGTAKHGEMIFGWRVVEKNGISFVCAVTDDVSPKHVERYLHMLQKRYYDEVDDLREPERDGVADVVVDVIPPWEDEE